MGEFFTVAEFLAASGARWLHRLARLTFEEQVGSTAEEEGKNPGTTTFWSIIAENRACDNIIGKPHAPHNRAGRVRGGA